VDKEEATRRAAEDKAEQARQQAQAAAEMGKASVLVLQAWHPLCCRIDKGHGI
jgi:hypothetical protein